MSLCRRPLFLSLLLAMSAGAQTFVWPAKEGATGYRLYRGAWPGEYTDFVDVGTATNAPVPHLVGTNYYALTGYAGTNMVESTFSAPAEVVILPELTLRFVPRDSMLTLQGSADLKSWTNIATISPTNNMGFLRTARGTQ